MCVCVSRYLESVEVTKKSKLVSGAPLRKVISMSLWGSKPRYTYGALRNAQLLPVFFPGWTLRFYIERPRYDETTMYTPVPPRIVAKLAVMGAEVVYVDAERSHIPPMMWRFLIADDMSVDAFIVRDSDCRLNDRDSTIVADWLRTELPFHCIRDHPSHAGYSLLGGLWGARPRQLRSFVAVPWRDMMMGYRTDYVQDMQFLANAVWPLVQSQAAFCHDSVSCRDWPAAHPFPVGRVGTEHLGQVFDAFGNARDEDLQILLEHRPLAECSVGPTPARRKTTPSADFSEENADDEDGTYSTTVPTELAPTDNVPNSVTAVSTPTKNASSDVKSEFSPNSASRNIFHAPRDDILPLLSRISSHQVHSNSNHSRSRSYDRHADGSYHSVQANISHISVADGGS